MADIKQAIQYAKENPNTAFATELRKRIEGGQMNSELQAAGIQYPSNNTVSQPKKGLVETAIQPAREAIQGLGSLYGGGEEGIANKLKTDITTAAQDIQAGNPKGVLKAGLRTAGDVAGAVYAPIGAAVQATGLNKVFDYIGEMSQKGGDYNPLNAITDIKSVQDFVKEHPNLEEDFGRVLNIALGAFDKGQIKPSTLIERTKTQFTPKSVPPDAGGGSASVAEGKSGVVGSIKNDVVPTIDRLINHEITKALDLTQGDVKNISLSTGNEVGRFIADKNLIGANKDTTISNINNFYKTNYDAVRSEIGKVKRSYDTRDIPRYRDALVEIKNKLEGVAGQEAVVKEVDSLLMRDKPILNDIQRVKELMDEHFSLYKATGDVKESIAKEGMANMRNDLKTFIEKEVKDATGTDIKELNNNVQTARSIANAVETRSTKGLTNSNITLGDIGTFTAGTAVGTPLFGAAAVFAKKIYESPSFKLRLSKWLDSRSDVQKARLQKTFEGGNVPKEILALPGAPKIGRVEFNNSPMTVPYTEIEPMAQSTKTTSTNKTGDIYQKDLKTGKTTIIPKKK